MNKLLVVSLLVFAMGYVTRAQEECAPQSREDGSTADGSGKSVDSTIASEGSVKDLSPVAPSFLVANAATTPSLHLTSRNFAADTPAVSLSAAEPSPAAAPEPRFVFGGRDDFRWQVGLGVSVFRFRSSLFSATGIGTDSSVTYFTNDWFGLEGRVSTSISPSVHLGGHVKVLNYGGGPKVAWRTRRFEPFVHAIFGGVHVFPQTAFSTNGFAFQLGGGAGYRFNPRFSTRIVLDWVPTHMFSQWQNNAQATVQFVLHF